MLKRIAIEVVGKTYCNVGLVLCEVGLYYSKEEISGFFFYFFSKSFFLNVTSSGLTSYIPIAERKLFPKTVLAKS